MGVHGLTGILSRYAPNAVRSISCNVLATQTIAIDASCHLNKFVYGDETHPHRHIYGFYQLARFCDLNKIKPIFVFDGPRRLEAKDFENAKRERTRHKVKHSLLFEKEQSIRLGNWMEVSDAYHQTDLSRQSTMSILSELGEALEDIDEYPMSHISDQKQHEIEAKLAQIAQELKVAIIIAENTDKYTKTVRDLANRERDVMADMVIHRFKGIKPALQQLKKDNQAMLHSLEKRSYRITQLTRDECQAFLKTMGYVCLTCDSHEAEAMCAHLSKSKRTTATVSEDLDTLVFGDAPILRYFFSRARPILSIDPILARKELGLTRESFVDFCILCGTDFSGTIRGIGPIRALKAIQDHGNIETLLAHLDSKYKPQETFNYKLARQVFNHLPPIPTYDEAYESPKTSELEKRDILSYYQIDPAEADQKLQSTMLLQNIQWGKDPFMPHELSYLNFD